MADFPEDQLLVAVFPGVPTAAELFLLPYKNQSEGKKKSEDVLERVWLPMKFTNAPNSCGLLAVAANRPCCLPPQASDVIVSALNQNLVEFELKPGVRVIVYNTQLTLGKKPL